MGVVYEAHDQLLGTSIAVKVLFNSSAQEELEPLCREALITRRITHPNVCRVFDVTVEDVAFSGRELVRPYAQGSA